MVYRPRPIFGLSPRRPSSALAERRRKPSTTLKERDVKRTWRAKPLLAPARTASPTSPKPAHVQASLEMARPRIEPGTPRFSEGPENPWLSSDLQDFFR